MDDLIDYQMDETVTLVNRYNFRAPKNATLEQIRDAAYATQPRVKWSELEESTILDDQGNEYDPEDTEALAEAAWERKVKGW